MCIDDGCIVESAKYATKQDLCKNRSDFAKKTQCVKKTYINHETTMLKCIDCEAPKFIRAKGPIDEDADPHPAMKAWTRR